MKKYFLNKYKLTVSLLGLFFFSVYQIIGMYILGGGCLDNCSFEYKNGFLDPVYNFSGIIFIFLLLLILLPARYLKKYLQYAFIPLLLVSWIIILSESPYSTGGVIGMSGRPFAATATAYGTIVLSVLFFIGLLLWNMLQRRLKK